ncbi:MAG: UxaA family hydrolase [Promethearchaeota archaeon]
MSRDQRCLHPPGDTEQVTTALINLGKNPNTGAALVIGLGCELVSAEEVYEGTKSSGKLVDLVVVHKLEKCLKRSLKELGSLLILWCRQVIFRRVVM